MQRYLLASIDHYANDTEITDSIKSSQAAWKVYRERRYRVSGRMAVPVSGWHFPAVRA